jgi:hypothetical protein
MTQIRLQFSCRIWPKGKQETKDPPANAMELTTSISSPIIAITNESQWAEAAGKLLATDTFSDSSVNQITFPSFANILQRHVIIATGQDLNQPNRPITDWEYKYIQSKFFGTTIQGGKLLREQAGTFWAWFGPVITTIRFKRHVKAMWEGGLIYGFISKPQCNNILANQEDGVFLVRFSDSVPGSFTVAYVDSKSSASTAETGAAPSERVKHFLIRPDDIGSNKSLPDFLRDKPFFKQIIRLHLPEKKLTKEVKDVILKDLYSKKQRLEKHTIEGYINNDNMM